MINVGELMTDPDFVRGFTVRRPNGVFSVDGVFTSSYRELYLHGIVQPASPRQIAVLPEGTRVDDVISVWCSEELLSADGKKQESDIIVVDGYYYRVVKAEPWGDAGYFRVFAEGYIP